MVGVTGSKPVPRTIAFRSGKAIQLACDGHSDHTSGMKLLHVLLLAAIAFHATVQSAEIKVSRTDGELTILRDGAPVLVYHKAIVPAPEGVDEAYARSGFIHPVYTPSGGEITGIHPDDHYHHLGLWHAWVHAEHEGQETDFWNLNGRTGAIRFDKVLQVDDTGFSVLQSHVKFIDKDLSKPIPVLREQFDVHVSTEGGANVIDYTFRQRNVTDAPLILDAYRYGGGIAYRAPLNWNKENSDYLTSEGLDRTNSHTTRANWVAMFGPTNEGTGTLAILCHPANHDAPQRVRTWDKGQVFFNYVPIQETGWQIDPGQEVTFRYRLVVLDGKVTAEGITPFWNAYAALP